MNLLVVEGNSREIWEKRRASGGVPYHQRFKAMLKVLLPNAKVEFAFPADSDARLPAIDKLSTFNGVLWTGSSFSANDDTQAVQRQLMYAEDVFKSGIPFYGSCWGLQIATVVAGGTVATCAKGREIGIAKPIELTKTGKNHPYFKGRKDKYSALCIHNDEVVKLPENSCVLAKNRHSKVQAMTIKFRKSEFFGVQYHPEFIVSDMAFIARYMSKTLLKEGTFKSENDIENFAFNIENETNVPTSVTDYGLHTREVKYWLNNLA